VASRRGGDRNLQKSKPAGGALPQGRRLFVAQLVGHVSQGRIRYHETVAQGIRSAPGAFIGMLKGENLGKQLVKLI